MLLLLNTIYSYNDITLILVSLSILSLNKNNLCIILILILIFTSYSVTLLLTDGLIVSFPVYFLLVSYLLYFW